MNAVTQKYEPAWERYIEHGNLARAARETSVNVNSLRSFARSYDWRAVREQLLADRSKLLRQVDRQSAKLVVEFYDKPSSKKAEMARKGLDIATALGAGGPSDRDGYLAYSGDKDTYRELIIASMIGAKKDKKYKEVVLFMEMLGKLDGHLGEKEQGDGVPMPDFAGIGQLRDPKGPVMGVK